MIKVLFVCTGNTCRSPMAERLCRDALSKANIKNIKISSAGLMCAPGFDMEPPTRETLIRLGVPAEAHKSRSVTPKLLKDNDIIIAMTAAHKYQIQRIVNYKLIISMTEIIGRDIDDPFGNELNAYFTAAEQIKSAMPHILQRIKELKNVSQSEKTISKERNGKKLSKPKYGRR